MAERNRRWQGHRNNRLPPRQFQALPAVSSSSLIVAKHCAANSHNNYEQYVKHNDCNAHKEADLSPFPSLLGAFQSLVILSCIVFRSEEHTSELQSLMRISYAAFFLQKKTSYI